MKFQLLKSGIASVLLIVSVVLVAPVHADVSDTQRPEVEHLLLFVLQSDCEIDRNGSLHNGVDAHKHMRKKYRHFRDEIDSTEAFIAKSASRSELSKKPYHVVCPDQARITTQQWLHNELKRFRDEAQIEKPQG